MGIRKISLFGKEGLGEILEEYDGDHGFINRNGLNYLSLREADRRRNPKEDEIATPFGLAMITLQPYRAIGCFYLKNTGFTLLFC